MLASRGLREGNSLALNDPRRMGKTVWLDLLAFAPPDDLLVAKIDYEGVRTSEEFLLRTVAGLRDHTSVPRRALHRIGQMFENVEIGGPHVTLKTGTAARSRTDLLTEVIASVDAALDGSILVVAMDEVPIAIDNIARNEDPDSAHQLLQALRELRRRPGSVRWIVCGSVGFHHVLKRCGATEGAINDLLDLPLGPLDVPEASELAERLLLGIERTPAPSALDEVLATIVDETDGVPFLIHAVAHTLRDGATGPCTPTDVRSAFERFLGDRDASRPVQHMVSRVDQLYEDRARQAKETLDLVALERSVDEGALDAADVIDHLVDDHYLVNVDGSVSWRYPVFERMWRQRRKLA